MKNIRIFIIIFILFLIFLPGFAKLQELKNKLAMTQEKIWQVQRRNLILEERIAQMQDGSASLEMVARDKLGIVRKGETVLKIIREDEPAAGTLNASNISKE